MIFPWQATQWKQLLDARQKNRLPHALLLAGIEGIGKTIFAEQFIRNLLCQRSDENLDTCDCHSCRLTLGRAHPNILWVQPEKEGQAIKVDQIREVCDFINQSSFQGEYRVALINPADQMNVNAANALLKTLEEPSSGAILLLISHQPSKLPATILSRCQRITFAKPNPEQAVAWLAPQIKKKDEAELLLNLANGAPLKALRLMEDDILSERKALYQALCELTQQQADPLKLAAKLEDDEPLKLIDLLLSWGLDLLRIHLNVDQSNITNRDYQTQLNEIKSRISLQKNHAYLQYLQQLRCDISKGINFNKALLLENVLIRWMECAA